MNNPIYNKTKGTTTKRITPKFFLPFHSFSWDIKIDTYFFLLKTKGYMMINTIKNTSKNTYQGGRGLSENNGIKR